MNLLLKAVDLIHKLWASGMLSEANDVAQILQPDYRVRIVNPDESEFVVLVESN